MYNWSLSTFPSEDEVTYKLETYKHNYMLIFSHPSDGFRGSIENSEIDVKSIKSTFRAIEFEIEDHKHLKKAEILDKLNILRDKDFTEYGCVAVVVLTRGGPGGTLMAEDGPYREKEIIEYFESKTNPTLITKPKILIVQARRRFHDAQTAGMKRTLIDGPGQPDLSYTLKLEPDILILHSSYPGEFFDSTQYLGFWFIQLLCKEIAYHSPILDLESIVTKVKWKIYRFSSEVIENARTQREYDFEGVLPISVSTLTRKLFFRKYKDYIECNENNFFKKMHEYFKFENEEDFKYLLYGS